MKEAGGDKQMRNDRLKIGIALSGGGLRGVSHIGILKVLMDENIPIDYIAGTSAGSIIAAFIALGHSPRYIESVAKQVHKKQLFDSNLNITTILWHAVLDYLFRRFSIWSLFPRGLIKGNRLEYFLHTQFQGKKLHDTRIPLAIMASDIHTGESIVFVSPHTSINHTALHHSVIIQEANLSDAVRASTAIPGIFMPKSFAGRWLVDGGLQNNLPTSILRMMGADVVIGVDLGYAGERRDYIDNIYEIIMQSFEIMSREITICKAEQSADLVIYPNVLDVGLTEVARIPEVIQRGEQAARDYLPAIYERLKR
jgi:NTE family protein